MSATPNFSASQIGTEARRDELLILSLIKDVRTAIPVKVVAVYPGTGSPPSIGKVDVQPLIRTVDGSGKAWLMSEIYRAAFSRIQAGATAIIVDPAVNDIGFAVVGDRDLSSVLALGAALATPSNDQIPGPGSARAHDISDLVYLFSIISAAAITQYILANANGITVLSPNTITLQGAQINLIGPVTQTNGDMTVQTKLTVPTVDATTDVTVPNGSVNDHVHGGVSTGGGSTGPMTG